MNQATTTTETRHQFTTPPGMKSNFTLAFKMFVVGLPDPSPT